MMPIKLKKPISSIEELTCENCIHFQDFGGGNICINNESYDWDRGDLDFCSLCSQGQWFKAMSFDDDSVVINLFGFSTMMQIFAGEEQNATRD